MKLPSLSDSSDREFLELLEKAQGGDGNALVALINRHRSFLLRRAQEEAEPVLQARCAEVVEEACVHARRVFAQFHGTTSKEMQAWLHTLLLNRLRDLRDRHDTRKREVALDHLAISPGTSVTADVQAARTTDAADRVISQSERDLFVRALKQLSDLDRTLIKLRHQEALPFADIARQLHLPEEGVQQRWLLALQALNAKARDPAKLASLDRWNEGWLGKLVQFDEGLRLGRRVQFSEHAEPGLLEAQRFLERLQGVWPRAPRRIGTYVLADSLGQGTLGMAYLVEDPGTHARFVLKLLWPNLAAEASVRAQLSREVQALRNLADPRVAAVHEVREAGQVCYLVSQYCPGPSLAQWRRRHPQPLSWEVSALLLAQFADILNLAHSQGIVHGNLKPTNIFLRSESPIAPGQIHEIPLCIADFAVANAVQQSRLLSQGGLPWPMPQYLAPEQLRHRTALADPASDLYALGVIGYELLTGRCPVKGSTREEVSMQTRAGRFPPPRQFRSEIPVELESLLLQCLHKNQRARPASAGLLAQALRERVPARIQESPRPAWWRRWLGMS